MTQEDTFTKAARTISDQEADVLARFLGGELIRDIAIVVEELGLTEVRDVINSKGARGNKAYIASVLGARRALRTTVAAAPAAPRTTPAAAAAKPPTRAARPAAPARPSPDQPTTAPASEPATPARPPIAEPAADPAPGPTAEQHRPTGEPSPNGVGGELVLPASLDDLLGLACNHTSPDVQDLAGQLTELAEQLRHRLLIEHQAAGIRTEIAGIDGEIQVLVTKRDQLRAALQELLDGPVTVSVTSNPRRAATADDDTIRSWALENHYELGQDGAIPNGVRAAFRRHCNTLLVTK